MMIDLIVVHCSASPQGRGDTAKTIHLWHLQRGWDGIGYHNVILEDGTVENGRPYYWKGSHVRGHNGGSIGICLIGARVFTQAQLDALEGLLDTLTEKYPDAMVCGHCDLDEKKPDCPGFNVGKWYSSKSRPESTE
jgi:N-acetylmuramoyl-L-alanine amidase